MKRKLRIVFAVFLGILSVNSSFAQVEKIKFTYDSCGNRTDKYIKVEKKTQVKEWSDGLNDSIIKEELPVRVYPNPTRGFITIESSDNLSIGSFEILITTVNGEVKHSGIINMQKTTFDLQDCAPGVYLIKLFNKEKSIIYKLVKQ